MRINRTLLVDDDSISNHVSKNALQKIHFTNELVIKTDGKEALEYLKNECKLSVSYPDLILLDLKMPGMDGFEFLEEFEMVCKEVRHHMVVVILTSSRNGDDIVKLRKLGNYFLINKPLTTDKLIDLHHRYFRDKEILK